MKTSILSIAAAGLFTVTVSGTLGGCAFLQGVRVEPEASVTVWYGLIGIRTQYVNADSTCITALSRTDTTASAIVSTVAGPACFDAYSYVRSFFPADTTRGEIPDGEPLDGGDGIPGDEPPLGPIG